MRIRATLIKSSTDDGIVELNDDVFPGKEYMVELQSICVKPWGKADGAIGPVNRFSIFVYNCHECIEGAWMPLELVKLEAE